MAVVPPSYANGDISNDSPYAPVPWSDIQPTQNITINQSAMPYSSTAEFKGYYRAEATGVHKFRLSGTEGVTGYAWISGAPSTSDRIATAEGTAGMRLTNDRSYGIKIPTVATQLFPESRFTGQNPFIGYGPWPRNGYGTSQNTVVGPNATNGGDGVNTAPGTNAQTELYPGQIRRFPDKADRPDYYTHDACCDQRTVGSWAFPESEQFGTAPLVDERYETGSKDCCDSSRTSSNVPSAGYASNYFRKAYLDGNFKAEGFDYEDVATWRSVSGRAAHIIWPENPMVGGANPNNRDIERVAISFTLNTRIEDTYTFKFQTYDQIKIWKKVATGSTIRQRNLISKLEPTVGENPIFAGTSVDGNATQRGAGTDGMWEFEAEITMGADDSRGVWIMGYCTGEPSQDTHGWGLLVYDSAGELVWDSSKLIASGEQFVGIDECGYNAYLDQDDRIELYRDSESYTLDGWKGYVSGGDVYKADQAEGDNVERSILDTRQYMPRNSLTRCRSGEVIEGSIYLRQGDFYFIRAIVSNHLSSVANYSFNVTTPTGLNSTVRFSGNGDPGSDTTVGGSAGGNGIPINTEVLCNSILTTTSGNNLNFALVERLGVAISLTELNVPTFALGREGQGESITIPGANAVTQPGEIRVNFDAPPGETTPVKIELSRLLRGNQDGVTELTQDEIDAVNRTYNRQLTSTPTPFTLAYETFRSAITSQAVIQWGSGGNYPYLYHSVDEVITAICDPTKTIDVPNLADKNTNNTSNQSTNNTSNQSTNNNSTSTEYCVDTDITVLGGGAAQITSECFDECKTPDQFPILTSQYAKKESDFSQFNVTGGYSQYVSVRTDLGVNAPSKWSLPYTPAKEPKDYKISGLAATEKNNVGFKPGLVTAMPLTVPEVIVPDNFDTLGSTGLQRCKYTFELSSNTFSWDPDETGLESGTSRPYMLWWVSVIPGGPKIGRYFINRPPYASTPRFYATMDPDQWIGYADGGKTYFTGYLGNTYGVRYWNIAPVKYDLMQDIFNSGGTSDPVVPEPGTQEFVDLLSDVGYKSNEIRIFGVVPSPDCGNT